MLMYFLTIELGGSSYCFMSQVGDFVKNLPCLHLPWISNGAPLTCEYNNLSSEHDRYAWYMAAHRELRTHGKQTYFVYMCCVCVQYTKCPLEREAHHFNVDPRVI